VVTKVTVPVLPVVVSVSVNDALLASVVEFVNGAVWVIVVGRRRGENRAAHSHLFARTVVRAAGVAGITGVGRVPLVGAVDRASRRRVTGRCGVRAVPVHRRRFGVDDGVTRVVEGEGYRPRRVVAARQGGRVLQGCRRRARLTEVGLGVVVSKGLALLTVTCSLASLLSELPALSVSPE